MPIWFMKEYTIRVTAIVTVRVCLSEDTYEEDTERKRGYGCTERLQCYYWMVDGVDISTSDLNIKNQKQPE
jgi:hypothetical protein